MAPGYFEKGPIFTPAPIDFAALSGQAEYKSELARFYALGGPSESWMTPAEIFAPLYSEALARFICEEHVREVGERGVAVTNDAGRGDTSATERSPTPNPLKIYEVGGGNGTNALHILNFLRDRRPELYANAKYTLVEISETLAERQRQRVVVEHPNVCEVVNEDFVGTDSLCDASPCFVIALEVLDNLAHDRIQWSEERGEWEEVRVCVREDGQEEEEERGFVLSEQTAPLGDDPETLAAARLFLSPPDFGAADLALEARLAAQSAVAMDGPETAAQRFSKLVPPGPAAKVATAFGSGIDWLVDLTLGGEGGAGVRDQRCATVQDAVLCTAEAGNGEREKREEKETEKEKEKGATRDHQLPRGRFDGAQLFVPTDAIRLSSRLRADFPRHTMIAADFDALPPAHISSRSVCAGPMTAGRVSSAALAPLVASRGALGGGGGRDGGEYNLSSSDEYASTDHETCELGGLVWLLVWFSLSVFSLSLSLYFSTIFLSRRTRTDPPPFHAPLHTQTLIRGSSAR